MLLHFQGGKKMKNSVNVTLSRDAFIALLGVLNDSIERCDSTISNYEKSLKASQKKESELYEWQVKDAEAALNLIGHLREAQLSLYGFGG